MSRAFGAFSLIVKIQNASSKMRLKARTKLESLKLELPCIPRTENQQILGKKDCDYCFTGICIFTNPSNYIHKICPFFVYQVYLDKAVREKKLQKIGLVYGIHFGKYGNTRNRQEIYFFHLSRIHHHDFLPCFCRKKKNFKEQEKKEIIFQGSIQLTL